MAKKFSGTKNDQIYANMKVNLKTEIKFVNQEIIVQFINYCPRNNWRGGSDLPSHKLQATKSNI